MAIKFVNVDRDTPMLLPPDLREWIPPDDMVHFVIEAVEGMKLTNLKVNTRGSGSAQYPPRMMLSLLIYCYSMGVFSSRRIQRATYRDICVRFLTGDTHPDHDTICAFRRQNFDLVAEVFLEVLKLGKAMGLVKIGAVALDGTHELSSASKHKNVGYERAGELEAQLKLDIAELMAKAEQSDNQDLEEGQKLPDGVTRREALKEKMAKARQELEKRAQAVSQAERAEYEKKLVQRKKEEDDGKGPKGSGPKEPAPKNPKDVGVVNLTDSDSRLMRKTSSSECRQCYNMQAVVDAEGSMLVLATDVSTCANDSGQLKKMIQAVPAEIGKVTVGLADTGYADAQMIEELEGDGVDMYVAVGKLDSHSQRQYDYRPKEMLEKIEKPQRPLKDPRLIKMREKLQTPEGKQTYARRMKTVEPVFGIIKSAMGFRQCLLRGLEKVRGEWSLVTLAYNFKRMWNLQKAM